MLIAQMIAALKKAGPELAGAGVEAMKMDALVAQRCRGWPARACCPSRCADRQHYRIGWAG